MKRRSRGSHYDTDHHLFHYTPAALRRLLTGEFGFEVLVVAGDFDTADQLRTKIAALGYTVEDRQGGPRVRLSG